jgi:carbamate kinase
MAMNDKGGLSLWLETPTPLESVGIMVAAMSMPRSQRLLIALGGNAIAKPASHDPENQEAVVNAAMEQVADLVAQGYEVALTHGNGPQVGDLLLRNELARDAVAPLPLDWCVAETQAVLGYLMANSLEQALRRRSLHRIVVPVITRVLVDPGDPGLDTPSKPVGQFVSRAEAAEGTQAGETWGEQGLKGWRRLVPSPEPCEILDRHVIDHLMDVGAVVVAAGGGGIPMTARNGGRRGVEAVLDKDLTGALLAEAIDADCFVIVTDVPAVALRYGTDQQEWLGRVTPARLRTLADEGHFADGSMGPKVEATLRFIAAGGERAVITSLDRVADGLTGRAGTVIETEALTPV